MPRLDVWINYDLLGLDSKRARVNIKPINHCVEQKSRTKTTRNDISCDDISISVLYKVSKIVHTNNL